MEVTLRPNRLRFLVLMILSAGFVASSALIVREGDLVGWAGILFFGSAAIFYCLLLLPGSAYLKLDPAGFTVCSLFRAHSFRWYEVDPFEVGTFRKRNLVVFNFSNLHRGHEFARRLSSAIGGYEGALLPEKYGLSAEELAATLNEWRERASSPAVSL